MSPNQPGSRPSETQRPGPKGIFLDISQKLEEINPELKEIGGNKP